MYVHKEMLRHLVLRRGWNAKQFAELANVSYSIVLKVMQDGGRETCSDATIDALAATLGVDPDVIATDVRVVRRVELRNRQGTNGAELERR